MHVFTTGSVFKVFLILVEQCKTSFVQTEVLCTVGVSILRFSLIKSSLASPQFDLAFPLWIGPSVGRGWLAIRRAALGQNRIDSKIKYKSS